MANLIEVHCPQCHSSLWIDLETGAVVEHKKTEKKAVKSFEDLLEREKEKKERSDERFDMAQKLEQEKKKKAEDFFKKSFGGT